LSTIYLYRICCIRLTQERAVRTRLTHRLVSSIPVHADCDILGWERDPDRLLCLAEGVK